MIKANLGKVEIDGDVVAVFADLVMIIEAVRESFTYLIDEEHADLLITTAGRVAYLSDEERQDGTRRKLLEDVMTEMINAMDKEETNE